ncbi:response regulator [Natronolimnobius sp. AArcel1]|uniref:response regulator n=1 Tax=Natronolimnobius sp. AArcel1 TaxID=1679093 RepID=UPI0013ECCBEF|nr:response regulator [Natronolimnobius sp. AArcel1]NGM70779.1 response regulator [Natronolimnobius sp. AArcel1]
MSTSDHTPNEPVDILIVEDNPGDVRLMQEAFGMTDSDVRFRTVSDGAEAAEYFRRCRTGAVDGYPDVILLDLNLPKKSGHALLELLGNEWEHPTPPVLVLSSSTADDDIHKSYDRNANAYLVKPDSPTEFDSLAKAIESFWIDRVQHPPSPA